MLAFSTVPLPDQPQGEGASAIVGFFNQIYRFVVSTFWLIAIILVLMASIIYAMGQTADAGTRARANQWSAGMATGAIIAVAIYVLVPWLFAQMLPETVATSQELKRQIFAGWEWYAMAAAVLSVIVATTLLMLSRAFGLKTLEQTAKTEMVYAASTAVIVLLLILLINAIEPALVDISLQIYQETYGLPQGRIIVPEDMTLINITKIYMEPVVGCVDNVMSALYGMSIVLEPLTSSFTEVYMSEHASGFAYKIFTERINNMAQVLFFYVYAYFILVHMLNFVQYYGLLFLTVGVVLRAFPPTRGMGAYIMAMSIGLYFVFPLSYILLSIMVGGYAGGAGIACAVPDIAEGLDYCGFENSAKIQELQIWAEMYDKDMTEFFDYFSFALLRELSIRVCFLPFVCLVIVLTFILNGSSLFGGYIPEIGRGIVKLI